MVRELKYAADAYAIFCTGRWDTDIKEARKMSQPVIIQRLFILKETIEEEYLEKTTLQTQPEGDSKSEEFTASKMKPRAGNCEATFLLLFCTGAAGRTEKRLFVLLPAL
uniref:Uncharacterized protein n=1 Tax=Salix viminalis TaxID=40686 RepID=A0A6N2MJ19_SALVM